VKDAILDVFALLDAAGSEQELTLALAERAFALAAFDRAILLPVAASPRGFAVRPSNTGRGAPTSVVEVRGPVVEEIVRRLRDASSFRADTEAEVGALQESDGARLKSAMGVAAGGGALVLFSTSRWAFPAASVRRLSVLVEAVSRLRPHLSRDRFDGASALVAEISQLSTERSALEAEVARLRAAAKKNRT
jgi:hypothetical protein